MDTISAGEDDADAGQSMEKDRKTGNRSPVALETKSSFVFEHKNVVVIVSWPRAGSEEPWVWTQLINHFLCEACLP